MLRYREPPPLPPTRSPVGSPPKTPPPPHPPRNTHTHTHTHTHSHSHSHTYTHTHTHTNSKTHRSTPLAPGRCLYRRGTEAWPSMGWRRSAGWAPTTQGARQPCARIALPSHPCLSSRICRSISPAKRLLEPGTVRPTKLPWLSKGRIPGHAAHHRCHRVKLGDLEARGPV